MTKMLVTDKLKKAMRRVEIGQEKGTVILNI